MTLRNLSPSKSNTVRQGQTIHEVLRTLLLNVLRKTFHTSSTLSMEEYLLLVVDMEA